jgi:hypothetical protein
MISVNEVRIFDFGEELHNHVERVVNKFVERWFY